MNTPSSAPSEDKTAALPDSKDEIKKLVEEHIMKEAFMQGIGPTFIPDRPQDNLRDILLAVRDWSQGLMKQEFDDDPLPGMSIDEAEQLIRNWAIAQLPEKRKGKMQVVVTGDEHEIFETLSIGYNDAIDTAAANLASVIKGREMSKQDENGHVLCLACDGILYEYTLSSEWNLELTYCNNDKCPRYKLVTLQEDV